MVDKCMSVKMRAFWFVSLSLLAISNIANLEIDKAIFLLVGAVIFGVSVYDDTEWV